MKQNIFIFSIVAALFAASCTKIEVAQPQGRVIATVEVAAEASEFPVSVKTVGVWSASSQADWLHVDSDLKKDNCAIAVAYDSNESTESRRNFCRMGHVVISTYDGFTTDTIVVKQRGLIPFLSLQDTEMPGADNEYKVPFNTNLSAAQLPSMTFSADADWVHSVEFGTDGASLLVKAGVNDGAPRTAQISASFKDAWGDVHTTTCTLTQLQSDNESGDYE